MRYVRSTVYPVRAGGVLCAVKEPFTVFLTSGLFSQYLLSDMYQTMLLTAVMMIRHGSDSHTIGGTYVICQ